MIYDSAITGINESDALSLLESVEDRFEDYTMAEATAITVGEQERNWTAFMKGVGFSELAGVMEGETVIYEGARLDKFIEKAKGYFKMALNKLAEITKSFIAKVDQLFRTNSSFVKKYKVAINKLTDKDVEDIEFKGYEFSSMDKPTYKDEESPELNHERAKDIISKENNYTAEKAQEDVIGHSFDGTFGEALTKKFFGGEKEKDYIKISAQYVKDQLKILEDTKTMKEKAKKSYTESAKKIKNIIKKLDNAQKKNLNKNTKNSDDPGLEVASDIDKAFSMLLTYWKAYSSAGHQHHGAYMRALGTRARQAKAVCTKALTASGKAKGKAEREKIKGKMEGFVDTDAFLGAVEFI